MDRAWYDATDAWYELRGVAHGNDAGGRADDVDDVAVASAGADGDPVRVKGADRNGSPCTQAELLRPSRRQRACELEAGSVAAVEFFTHAPEQRIDRKQEIL